MKLCVLCGKFLFSLHTKYNQPVLELYKKNENWKSFVIQFIFPTPQNFKSTIIKNFKEISGISMCYPFKSIAKKRRKISSLRLTFSTHRDNRRKKTERFSTALENTNWMAMRRRKKLLCKSRENVKGNKKK